ncbi:hypothetical protein CLU79DRAFT_738030 [Phycomyces nitens]|nr:hypothetical protein CLU79DRAFT_738030 [Phycomyces nitens]
MRLIKKYVQDNPDGHQVSVPNSPAFALLNYPNSPSSQESLLSNGRNSRSQDIRIIKNILARQVQMAMPTPIDGAGTSQSTPIVTQRKSPQEATQVFENASVSETSSLHSHGHTKLPTEFDGYKAYYDALANPPRWKNATEKPYQSIPESAGVSNGGLDSEVTNYFKTTIENIRNENMKLKQYLKESTKNNQEQALESLMKKDLERMNKKYAVLFKANTSLKRGIKKIEKDKDNAYLQAQVRNTNHQKEIKDLQESLAAVQLELSNEKENREILATNNFLLKDENEKLKEKNIELLNQAQSRERRCERIISSLRLQSTTAQAELIEKKMEYQILLSEFQGHVDAVPAVEDDLFTIHAKLNIVQTKISNLCLNLKDFLNPNETEVYNIFFDNWKEDSFRYKTLMEKRADGSYGFDYDIISLLVESFITEYLIKEVYDVPIYLGLPINSSYTQLSEWEPFKNCSNWSRKLRKQLCSLASRPEISEKLGENRAQVIRNILQPLSVLFTRISPETVTKVTAIVNLASQISLAMHGQDVPIKCVKLKEGKDKINNTMQRLYGSIEGETTIQIVVCPPFIANEGQETESVLLEGKVICFDRIPK